MHRIAEMKARNCKLKCRHLRQLNRLLGSVTGETDPELRERALSRYLKILAISHKNGRDGSLVNVNVEEK